VLVKYSIFEYISSSVKYSSYEYFSFYEYIQKKRKWVKYLTDRKDITMTETYNSERLKRIKTEYMDIINGKINHNVEASITNMIINPNEEWLARKKTHYLS